ncbi:hypothetical protein BT93_L5723 [Corymbia citriodora subsp. variegata]|uniref:F-box domain-containing protein n=1 Tax=Corymbia citriodora subsp. variegata TaxID=360336 RepID=A0A8T0CVR4_CORYI|nr:hypothetical protein BT93_L5723 [Corymbia citriodora subsp. variegata]
MSSSSRGRGGGGPKLPRDVTIEILKRLPARSLLRFRCVCRSWRSTIDDPHFVALHSSHSPLDASNWYLVCVDWCDPDGRLCSLFPSESLALHSRSEIEIPFVNPVNSYSVVGSCNGLICFSELSRDTPDETIYVWNIFTRKHKAVRPSHPDLFFMENTPEGFGFDASSNDYKIVRILYPDDEDDEDLVEVYSLSTDSWRSLECKVPAFCALRPAVFLNGNLHWHLFEYEDPREHGGCGSILSFDLADEVFDEMYLPEEMFYKDSGDLTVNLAVLNDFLAVFIHFTDQLCYEPHSACSVWVMMEYGMPKSWTKLYSFEAHGQVTGFYGFTRDRKLLMEIDDEERVSRDPLTGQYANLPLSAHFDLVTVVESLHSL